MEYVTYENRNNPHITIHKNICNQIAKRGGEGKGKYETHNNLNEAEKYASSTGLPIIFCSFCNPEN